MRLPAAGGYSVHAAAPPHILQLENDRAAMVRVRSTDLECACLSILFPRTVPPPNR